MKMVFTLFMLAFIWNQSFSQPGTLDKTFGEEGKVLLTTSTGYPFPVYSVIAKNDGNIIAGSGEAVAFIVKEFLSNGTTDSSFGIAGEARTTFDNYLYANINSLSITEDNKIVAAGNGIGGAGSHNNDVLLARYLENGAADLSFGINGKVIADFNLIEIVNCMKITNQGKILVAGYCAAGDDGKDSCFLAQFNSDGSLDANFGDNGKVTTDVGASYQSYINSIAIEPDGSIIAAGYAAYIRDFQQNQILLAKYDINGKLDSNFGNKGLVFTRVSSNADYGYAVALQNDEKIVVAGAANYKIQDSSAMAIVRYNSDGSLDKSFNDTGFLSIFFGIENAIAKALIIQPDGNYILGGSKAPDHSSPPNYAAADFALASVTKDGKVDSLFGTNGLVTTDFDEGQDECDALALQEDGKIIGAGGSVDPIKQIGYIALSRYNGFQTQKQIIITKIKKWIQHHNGLTWNDNNNISSYVVQRGYDGIHFNSIARITASNSSNYTYADPMPLSGRNYYRLQTTSVNGAVNYSNIIAVTSSDNTIKISPNPATNTLHIEGLSSQQTKLTVVDFIGNIKLQIVVNASPYNLNIASLKAGNYLLKIETNDDGVTKTFIKE